MKLNYPFLAAAAPGIRAGLRDAGALPGYRTRVAPLLRRAAAAGQLCKSITYSPVLFILQHDTELQQLIPDLVGSGVVFSATRVLADVDQQIDYTGQFAIISRRFALQAHDILEIIGKVLLHQPDRGRAQGIAVDLTAFE